MTAGMQAMEHVLGGYAARLCDTLVQEQHQSAVGAPAGDAASNMRSRTAHGTVRERPICPLFAQRSDAGRQACELATMELKNRLASRTHGQP